MPAGSWTNLGVLCLHELLGYQRTQTYACKFVSFGSPKRFFYWKSFLQNKQEDRMTDLCDRKGSFSQGETIENIISSWF